MRRKDREITQYDEIIKIVGKGKVMRLAMVDEGKPYVVPLNYGFITQDGALKVYFHSALNGRKIDIINKCPDVCFVIDCDHEIKVGQNTCSYGYKYSSVIGEGTASIIQNLQEKQNAMTTIMQTQTGKSFSFDQNILNSVTLCKIDVTAISAKACTK